MAIEPTEDDLGRRVKYTGPGAEGMPGGSLTRFTEHYAFVTWDVWNEDVQKLVPSDSASPTSFAELEWVA
jgi:hypothetical protein